MDELSLGLLTTSIHLGVIGVFFLVVKTTIWNENTSFTSKLFILAILYYIYAFMIAPTIDGMARGVLGMPAETEQQVEGSLTRPLKP